MARNAFKLLIGHTRLGAMPISKAHVWQAQHFFRSVLQVRPINNLNAFRAIFFSFILTGVRLECGSELRSFAGKSFSPHMRSPENDSTEEQLRKDSSLQARFFSGNKTAFPILRPI